MVIESPPAALTGTDKQERRRRLLQRHGLLRTFNKLAFNWFRSRFLAAADALAVRNQLFPRDAPVTYLREVPTITVPNINAPECVQFVRSLAPDLLAVCGTNVIKPEVFTLARLGAVNIHTGITPDYRSADPIFWAIYHREPHKVGVTIHFVDQGIDTGAIIHQQSVPLYRGDSTATIYARCVRTGAELYLRALDEIRAGSVRTVDHGRGNGKAFYSINMGIMQYLIFRWRFRRLKRGLPAEKLASTAAEAG